MEYTAKRARLRGEIKSMDAKGIAGIAIGIRDAHGVDGDGCITHDAQIIDFLYVARADGDGVNESHEDPRKTKGERNTDTA
jgi:hypothetical protein